MDVNFFKDCELVMESELIEARKRFVSDSTKAIEIQLKPGGEIPEHGTPESVIFYVLEGGGTLGINGETIEVKPGAVAHCPSEVNKSIVNNGDTLLKVLVVKMS